MESLVFVEAPGRRKIEYNIKIDLFPNYPSTHVEKLRYPSESQEIQPTAVAYPKRRGTPDIDGIPIRRSFNRKYVDAPPPPPPLQIQYASVPTCINMVAPNFVEWYHSLMNKTMTDPSIHDPIPQNIGQDMAMDLSYSPVSPETKKPNSPETEQSNFIQESSVYPYEQQHQRQPNFVQETSVYPYEQQHQRQPNFLQETSVYPYEQQHQRQPNFVQETSVYPYEEQQPNFAQELPVFPSDFIQEDYPYKYPTQMDNFMPIDFNDLMDTCSDDLDELLNSLQ